MENWELFAKKILELMGFSDFKVEVDGEHNHGAVYIYDSEQLVKENLPDLIEHFNHLIQLAAKKHTVAPVFFDINNYRREREMLISQLARTAARKVAATRRELSLPAMNSYERRLVHMELAAHPNVVTESVGNGRERYVIVKPILEESARLTVVPPQEAAS